MSSIWVIFIAVMIASLIIQQTLKSKFRKYSKVPAPNGMTGADVAKMMLQGSGINDVKIQACGGMLTDHYNPANKTINLSEDVCNSCSISAIAIAAHETGHAIQHACGYGPLKMRSALVPVVTFANGAVSWVILLGILMLQMTPAPLWIGIVLFAITTLFSFITLPVEINASKRAIDYLTERQIIVAGGTRDMAVDALKWAAYTYVIAAVGSLATLLYYIALASRR